MTTSWSFAVSFPTFGVSRLMRVWEEVGPASKERSSSLLSFSFLPLSSSPLPLFASSPPQLSYAEARSRVVTCCPSFHRSIAIAASSTSAAFSAHMPAQTASLQLKPRPSPDQS